MDRSRRRLLAGGLAAALAGCLASVRDGPGGDPPEQSESPATTATATTATTTEHSDTVEVTTTVDREGLEYVESNDTVRYVAYWRTDRSGETPTRDPVYEYVPFEEWAEVECASVAAERAMTAMDRRLDEETDGVSAGVTAEDGERRAFVVHQTLLDREGDVVSKPSVPYERVNHVAPERVEVALSFAGRTHECTVPVTTREETIRQQ